MQGTNASNPKTFHRLPGGFQKQVCHNTSRGNGVVWTLEKFGSRDGGTPSAERIAHAVIPNGEGARVHASVRVHQGQALYSIIAAGDHDDVCDSTSVRWVIHPRYAG